jgi:hypothetical protein
MRILRAIALFGCLALGGCANSQQVAQRMAGQEQEDDTACRSVQMDYAACRSGLIQDRQQKKAAIGRGLRAMSAAVQQYNENQAMMARSLQPQVTVVCPFGRVC